jgi:Uma2 family endonuclease
VDAKERGLMATKAQATLDDLYNAPDDGKYELVDGRLAHMSPTGVRPGRVAGNIFFFLKLYEQQTSTGYAFGDNVGFVVHTPHERTFSPDAAFLFDAPLESDDFYEGPPVFAVEVRSKRDYGPKKDAAYAAKRAEYFAAGTRAVWDMRPRHRTIIAYYAGDPEATRVFHIGEDADAEPVLPGWRVAVADLMQ